MNNLGLFFGTDGIRGKVNEDLTFDIAFKIGNALSMLKVNPKIIIGCDTRTSNSYLTLALSSGAMSGGGKVIDIGVCPTAGIAYITKILQADYGVVISASHNSGEYNGIKIFNSLGYKLGEKEEEKIERCFIREKVNSCFDIGRYKQDFSLVKKYKDFLINSAPTNLNGLTIVLDGAYGASYKIAPEVFKKLNAKVIACSCKNKGEKINDNCGALFPENLKDKVLKYKADIGFAFDGDSDRVIALDENANVIDGDQIMCGIAKYLNDMKKLNHSTVVGTSHTNMGIENQLKTFGINLIRTDIGDKYVLHKLIEQNLSLGGEQSGHIILKDLATTGDGILSALFACSMLKLKGKKTSQIFNAKLYPQINKNILVKDKFRIMNSEHLLKEISKYNDFLSGKGRLMIRASGTEPKIRIMVESTDKIVNEKIAKSICNTIENLNKNDEFM